MGSDILIIDIDVLTNCVGHLSLHIFINDVNPIFIYFPVFLEQKVYIFSFHELLQSLSCIDGVVAIYCDL